MSLQFISKYYSEVDKRIKYGGTHKESSIKTVFQNLLNEYAQTQNLLLIPELDYRTAKGKTVYPDGTLKDALRLDWGYWESKDTDSDLETEIEKKFKQGYPNSNILFEDSQTAILYQKGDIIGRCDMRNPKELNLLLTRFVTYTRSEVRDFRDAIEKFKEDLPQVLDTLRQMIEQQVKENKNFVAVRESFLELCKNVINENVELADVNEMLIQHILTEEIFTTVFDDPQFHQENNISKELQKLERTFFTGKTKHDTLDTIKIYYQMIKARAGEIANHTEKQKFLKVVYENFYKGYNPKAADRLGIIYTPDEIVRFMIESTDYLLHKHFGKLLASKNVEILDPATGTGTFICDIIDHLPENSLKYKYQNEIHCNEVAILPYYIANLNIEATFKQKMGFYGEFKNICFVDTLDNVGFEFKGKQKTMFSLSSENSLRINAQNKRKISVIIGNPPYNANQLNENENNKNREYPIIDRRIKDTYIKHSTAQKTKVYDMYARFLRWASDRIDKNGIIAFVSNNSFIDSRTYDGFRKCIAEEFNDIYMIDLKGNARTAGERRRAEGGNVFTDEIRVGIAIYFIIKKENKQGFQVHYNAINDYAKAHEKKAYLAEHKISELSFETLQPDKNNNWINLADTDFDELLPLVSKHVKSGKNKEAVFKLFSLGVVTARDEWVYDETHDGLANKIQFLIEIYNSDRKKLKGKTREEVSDLVDYTIKWTRAVKNDLVNDKKYAFDEQFIIDAIYRPFVKRKLYFKKELTEMQYQLNCMFPNNCIIAVNQSRAKAFNVLASKYLPDYHFNGDSNCISYYYYDKDGNRNDNITDWGLKQFQEHYKNKKITKEDIFHYTYGVLHNPEYRKKYEINLKREFPRIPFYEDFKQWRDWGKDLIELHINFETAKPFNLKRIENKEQPKQRQGKSPSNQLPESKQAKHTLKPRLKADRENGTIEIDEQTSLSGVPKEAWEYKLGNRSALEWVLEQYKEYKPSDPTIAEKFNTYRFADYKEKVIDLLNRVCTVSIKTMEIINHMV